MTLDAKLRSMIVEMQQNGLTLDQVTTEFEKKYIDVALENSRGNVTQASKRLGIHRNSLHNKIRVYGLDSFQIRIAARRMKRGRG